MLCNIQACEVLVKPSVTARFARRLSRQLEMHKTEDAIVHDRVINNGDEADVNEDDDDSMEGTIANCVAEQDFDGVSEVKTRWDKNHDFTQSHQEHVNPLYAHNRNKIQKKCWNQEE